MTRQSPRMTVRFEARLSGAATGQGVVYNLSSDGCQIESPLSIQAGMKLTVVMDIERESLAVESAAVRWANPPYFGVEFLVMQPQAQARLNNYLSTLFYPSTGADRHDAAHSPPLETGVRGKGAHADTIAARPAEDVALEHLPIRDERQILLPFL